LDWDDRIKRKAKVVFVGAITKETILARDKEYTKPGRAAGSTHFNYEIPYNDLIPIREYLEKYS
jgi:hypothetical protein